MGYLYWKNILVFMDQILKTFYYVQIVYTPEE